MPYQTIFDITQKSFEWSFAAFGLIFIVIGAVLIKFGPKPDDNKNAESFGFMFTTDPKLVGWLFVIIASAWTLIVFGLSYSTYRTYLSVYRRGQCSLVEGVVQDFRPMSYPGTGECFRVNAEKFCYSDSVVSPAFHQSASHGGPIRAGLPVRLAYYEDADLSAHILRLEIRADRVPPDTERTAYAKTKEEKWYQSEAKDETRDNFLLGFSFGMLIIALCWNLDWKHYIGYWISPARKLPPIVQWGFRAFFIACLFGSGVRFAKMIEEGVRTFRDYERAGMFSLIPIGFFGGVDLIVRWRLHRRNRAAVMGVKTLGRDD